MIWNFGEVYKIIRKSKGISQLDICADELSRSTLSKIENNKLMPSFQIMDYLLKQINMTFDEFEYICNQYQPSTRYILIKKIYSVLNNYSLIEIKEIILECQDYLKLNHDLYIETFLEILKLNEQMSSSNNINYPLKNIAESIWKKLEESDEWYFFDLILLNNILFYFHFDIVKKLAERLLMQLEKCGLILEKAYPIIKILNKYDYLAIFWIRSGICKNNAELIRKGKNILELVDEKDLLKELEVEINRFS